MAIRAERPANFGLIKAVTRAALRGQPFSAPTKHHIVRALRAAGAFSPSLVATIEGAVVGQVAFSPVTLDGRDAGWYGLGQVSIRPERQRRGIGSPLMRDALARRRAQGAQGGVVLGDPRYDRRFGFAPHASLRLPGVSADHFMALAFAAAQPAGRVAYHPAFAIAPDAAA